MQTKAGHPRPTGRTEVEFFEFFLEDGPGLGLEKLRVQGGDEGGEPPSSDEESYASSDHHCDNESVGYSVEECTSTRKHKP